MKKYIPQQQKFESFLDLVEAATTTYTLSFKGACKALKCSRSWAQTYIRPNVPHIYLSNGMGTNKPNYAKIVSQEINKRNGEEDAPFSYESIYLDEAAFNKFIRDSIVSCQKRSKLIYKSYFIKKEDLTYYYISLLDLYMRLGEAKYRSDKKNLREKMDKLYLYYTDDKLVKDILHPAMVSPTKRTEAEFIDVTIPETPISQWKAVHDLMDYGDIEETIYRQLFSEGNIRVEIKLPDKNGVVKDTGKVYYISDPEPIKRNILSADEKKCILSVYQKSDEIWEKASEKLESLLLIDKMNVKQAAWVEYNNALSRKVRY